MITNLQVRQIQLLAAHRGLTIHEDYLFSLTRREGDRILARLAG